MHINSHMVMSNELNISLISRWIYKKINLLRYFSVHVFNKFRCYYVYSLLSCAHTTSNHLFQFSIAIPQSFLITIWTTESHFILCFEEMSSFSRVIYTLPPVNALVLLWKTHVFVYKHVIENNTWSKYRSHDHNKARIAYRP